VLQQIIIKSCSISSLPIHCIVQLTCLTLYIQLLSDLLFTAQLHIDECDLALIPHQEQYRTALRQRSRSQRRQPAATALLQVWLLE
jgi:hypothetical protein